MNAKALTPKQLEERRRYNREAMRRCRARMSEEKKAELKAKQREYDKTRPRNNGDPQAVEERRTYNRLYTQGRLLVDPGFRARRAENDRIGRQRRKAADPDGYRAIERANDRKPERQRKKAIARKRRQLSPDARRREAEWRKEYRSRPEVKKREAERMMAWRKTAKGKRFESVHRNAADIDICIAEANRDRNGRPLCIYSGRPLRIEGRNGIGKAVAEHIDPDIKGTGGDGPDNWVLACGSINVSKSNRCLYEWHRAVAGRLRLRPLADILADMRRLGKRIPKPRRDDR